MTDHRNAEALTGKIVQCAFTVSNALGAGFLEKVYRNALAHELRKRGVDLTVETPLPVFYDGIQVGDYRADLLVDRRVIVETKATRGIDEVHVAQLLNYLKATHLKVGLLLNFGTPRVGIKRLVR